MEESYEISMNWTLFIIVGQCLEVEHGVLSVKHDPLLGY